MLKILQIGCGCGGSWLVNEICECMEQEQIKDVAYTIADDDMIEMKQIKPKGYQNFKLSEVGMNKAEALAKRYSEFGINSLNKRITKTKQLAEYNLIILCVDNEKTREMVIRYCHKTGKEFLDLRATGRRMFVMCKEKDLIDNLKFIDVKDMESYSCQDKVDLERGRIQNCSFVLFSFFG